MAQLGRAPSEVGCGDWCAAISVATVLATLPLAAICGASRSAQRAQIVERRVEQPVERQAPDRVGLVRGERGFEREQNAWFDGGDRCERMRS